MLRSPFSAAAAKAAVTGLALMGVMGINGGGAIICGVCDDVATGRTNGGTVGATIEGEVKPSFVGMATLR